MSTVDLNRRQFILASATVAGGLALGFATGSAAGSTSPAKGGFEPWLVIDPDNGVTVRVTTPEIGTGASTQLAMTVAEELHCDWSAVKLEYASLQMDDANAKVFSRATPVFSYFSGRSTSSERNQTLLRVGATARERLKLAAAQTWKVQVAEVSADKGVLSHRATGRTLSFGQVAALAATVELAAEPALKSPRQWTLLGKARPPRLQLPAIVNGSAQYGIDIRLPGMLYAALMQSPVQDGTLKSAAVDAVAGMAGVKGVVLIEGGAPVLVSQGLASQPWLMGDRRTSAVAVVAEHYWQARKALAAMQIEWHGGAGEQWKTGDQIVDKAVAILAEKGQERRRVGDPEVAMAKQPRIVEATYTTPYCDQAPIEPLNGTALVTEQRVDLWHPTQITDNARAVVVEETGLAPEQVHVHQTLVGGAFGRRTTNDDVRMVVAVAAQFPGIPVHTIWSREESFRQGRYRALMAAKLRMGLDETGMPQAMDVHLAAKSIAGGPPFDNPLDNTSMGMGMADSPYSLTIVPNVVMTTHELPVHIRSGAYRGPYYNSNCFFVESFIDECAHQAGIDPLAYRLKLYQLWPDKGWTRCLEEVAAKSGWGEPLPRGMARGIAIGNFGMFGQPEAGTTVATVATVEVSPRGELRVHRLDLAFDCGSYMNLDAVLQQMEGGTVYGLNMALNEKLSIRDGRIVEGNYDSYKMLRLADMPEIRVHTGAITGHQRFAELGEVAVGTPGPAIANAIFAITGKRLRSTPLLDHDLSWG